MTILDIVLLIITAVLVIVGFCRGFIKSILHLGATVLALIGARLIGGALGREFFPEIISRSSPIGSGMTSARLNDVNASLATILGALVVFLVLYFVLKLILRMISKRFDGNRDVGIINRLLGAALGFVMALGTIYAFACILDVVAIVLTLIGSDWDIYEAVDSSVIFKYFF